MNLMTPRISESLLSRKMNSYYALHYMNKMKCYTQGFGSIKEVEELKKWLEL